MTAPTLQLPVKVLRSASAGRRPGDGTFRALTDGELFINTQDRVACMLDASGALFAWPIDPNKLALLVSPGFTGTPTAPTPSSGDNSTSLATTAYADRAAASGGLVKSVAGRTGAVTLGVADVSGAAPLASPSLTGTVNVGTAATSGLEIIQGPKSSSPSLQFQTNAYSKWNLFPYGTESGSNTGADLVLQCYDDSGSYITNPLSFKRSTGQASFSTRPSFNGSTPYDTGNLTAAQINNIAGYTVGRTSNGVQSSVGNINSTGIAVNPSVYYSASPIISCSIVVSGNTLHVTGSVSIFSNSAGAAGLQSCIGVVDNTAGQWIGSGCAQYCSFAGSSGAASNSSNPCSLLSVTPGHQYTIYIFVWCGDSNNNNWSFVQPSIMAIST